MKPGDVVRLNHDIVLPGGQIIRQGETFDIARRFTTTDGERISICNSDIYFQVRESDIRVERQTESG